MLLSLKNRNILFLLSGNTLETPARRSYCRSSCEQVQTWSIVGEISIIPQNSHLYCEQYTRSTSSSWHIVLFTSLRIVRTHEFTKKSFLHWFVTRDMDERGRTKEKEMRDRENCTWCTGCIRVWRLRGGTPGSASRRSRTPSSQRMPRNRKASLHEPRDSIIRRIWTLHTDSLRGTQLHRSRAMLRGAASYTIVENHEGCVRGNCSPKILCSESIGR